MTWLWQSVVTSRIFILLMNVSIFVLCCSFVVPATFAAGPGLGQLTYSDSEVMQPISRIVNSGGHGYVHMVDGYLFVPFSQDGNIGGGGFSFINIANPRGPIPIYTYKNAETDSIVGSHGFGFSDGKLVHCSLEGIVTWDIADPTNPVKLSSLTLGTGTGYGATCWSVSYQAPYAYVGAGSSGLHIVDLSDPANPVLVYTMTTPQLGGISIHNVHVVGNLLVATKTNNQQGYIAVDISEPATPVLIKTYLDSSLPRVYSGFFNGNRLYGLATNGFLHIHDFSDLTEFRYQGKAFVGDYKKGGYATTQDGYVFAGYSDRVAKVDIQDPSTPVLTATASTDIANADQDFAVVMGNLIFDGNDHNQGSSVIVHQAAPDTTAPSVNMFSPADGATNQSLNSRIGITLSDMVTIESVDQSSLIIRPQGGSPVTGTYSVQFDKVNFWPDDPLLEDTTYEIVIPADGIEDWSGNPTTSTFTSSFSTGSTPPGQTGRLTCTIDTLQPEPIDTATNMSGQANNAQGIVLFRWDFGDEHTSTTSADASVTHNYTLAGNHPVTLTVSDDDESANCAAIQVIHNSLTQYRPVRSATVIFDGSTDRAYNVNPDNDTVSAISESGNKLWEVSVGRKPVSLTRAPDGSIWVVNQDDAKLTVISASDGALLNTYDLPYASRPFGIAAAPDDSAIYVTLQATGQLLKLDPDTGKITGNIDIGSTPRGIAISGDAKTLLVSRFVSAQDEGEVTEVALNDFTVTSKYSLAVDNGPDTEASGRGVPNYINSVAISPDGLKASVPSKKDNTLRGVFRDGQDLTFESTVRAITSQLDMVSKQEVSSARIDINDSSMPIDAAYNLYGNHLYIALQGSNRIHIRDAYDPSRLLGIIEDTGFAPDGIALNTDNSLLFVHNFLARTVEIYDVSGFTDNSDFVARKTADVSVVADEVLSPQVLRGKQIFYNADDLRMSRDGYLNCAVCHLDGMSDERVWDFTGRGEGLRNTISLLGRRGTGHGKLHWTANFDEVHDFENDIRSAFDGAGLMADNDFDTGTRSDPLGDQKAGVSDELDALAAYVASLQTGHDSPYRNPDGSLTTDALEGKTLFENDAACLQCHSGPDFTDKQRHDTGTVQPHSGHGSNLPLSDTGIDTPTLLGIWETAPYLHDGSAATLSEVLENPQHGNTASLTVTQKDKLVAYLLQLEVDGEEQAPRPPPPEIETEATTDTVSASGLLMLSLILMTCVVCRRSRSCLS